MRIVEEIVARLVGLSTTEKEKVGNRIAVALGADPTKVATGLPTLKGNQDGGIDGRFYVLREVSTAVRVFNESRREWVLVPAREQRAKERLEAGLSVKLEGSSFSRVELNSFVEDLRREGLTAGLVVSAAGLSDHAQAELERHNSTSEFILVTCTVGELISGLFDPGVLEFESDPATSIRKALEGHLC